MKRRSNRERFSWHSVRRYVQQHRREHTDAAKDAAVRWFLIESGATVCRQCDRWWKDATLDETARALGVTIVRASEATLAVCPRCALYAQVLGVLESRIQRVQLSVF
jgi:hypothetical protein